MICWTILSNEKILRNFRVLNGNYLQFYVAFLWLWFLTKKRFQDFKILNKFYWYWNVSQMFSLSVAILNIKFLTFIFSLFYISNINNLTENISNRGSAWYLRESHRKHLINVVCFWPSNVSFGSPFFDFWPPNLCHPIFSVRRRFFPWKKFVILYVSW